MAQNGYFYFMIGKNFAIFPPVEVGICIDVLQRKIIKL
jgi:hypothetical protein